MKEIIGTIDFSECIEEQSILETRDVRIDGRLNKCDIDVYPDEGPIPHFHITSQNSSFKTCLYLFEPRYFLHSNYDGIFTPKQLKFLDSWLRETNKSKKYLDKTYWESLVLKWEQNGNPLVIWKENNNNSQPNYTLTKPE